MVLNHGMPSSLEPITRRIFVFVSDQFLALLHRICSGFPGVSSSTLHDPAHDGAVDQLRQITHFPLHAGGVAVLQNRDKYGDSLYCSRVDLQNSRQGRVAEYA